MTSDSPLRLIRRQVFACSQEELAIIGGVSRPRVSRYETGANDPPFTFLRRVRAEALRRGLEFTGDWFFEPPAAAPPALAEPGA